MPPRKKTSGHTILRISPKKSSPSGFYTPFHNLKQRLMHTDREKPPSWAVKPDASAIPVKTATLGDEPGLLEQAMADVVPLDLRFSAKAPLVSPTGWGPLWFRSVASGHRYAERIKIQR